MFVFSDRKASALGVDQHRFAVIRLLGEFLYRSELTFGVYAGTVDKQIWQAMSGDVETRHGCQFLFQYIAHAFVALLSEIQHG